MTATDSMLYLGSGKTADDAVRDLLDVMVCLGVTLDTDAPITVQRPDDDGPQGPAYLAIARGAVQP